MSSYYGKCGMCKYCELGDKWASVIEGTKFKCTEHNRYVAADEDRCGYFEVDDGRTSDVVERYLR